VEEFVSCYDLWPYVQTALGVDPQHPHKADPALLQILFDQLAVSPAQTLMVGDSRLDVAVAQKAGMIGCIGFSGGWTLNLPPIATADVGVSHFEQILLA
jgi:phosphoglycolate phosphatase-like HAD superfamily hydrolase